MEKFQIAREESKKYVKIADHMLTITYPLVNDPKLLLAIMENLFLSMSKAMGALLYYERMFKKIPPFHDTFESKFNLFKHKVARMHNINPVIVNMIEDIKNAIVEHKNSPVEFVRKDVFVICSENYRMRTLTVKEMKDYVSKAKVFIAQISNIVSQNERIFR
ncbi:hypothetical protein GOV08_01220 [Candidatus Woesearchaeota archaeon]|nr:hypothetical protein [Candidatus Woesearchaeota archaeon]